MPVYAKMSSNLPASMSLPTGSPLENTSIAGDSSPLNSIAVVPHLLIVGRPKVADSRGAGCATRKYITRSWRHPLETCRDRRTRRRPRIDHRVLQRRGRAAEIPRKAVTVDCDGITRFPIRSDSEVAVEPMSCRRRGCPNRARKIARDRPANEAARPSRSSWISAPPMLKRGYSTARRL